MDLLSAATQLMAKAEDAEIRCAGAEQVRDDLLQQLNLCMDELHDYRQLATDALMRLDALGKAVDNIIHHPEDYGPCHSGSKENYEWQGRSPAMWEKLRREREAAQDLTAQPRVQALPKEPR